MRMSVLSLCLTLGLLPLAAQAEDLMDVYRQAIANDPVLATADAQRLVVAEGVPQARSALLPQLSAGLSLEQIHAGGSTTTIDSNGNLVDASGGGHTRQRDLSLTLSQPVVDLASIANLRAAHATSDAQEQTYRGELQNLYVRVATAYFNVLIAQDQLAVYQSYEDAYKQEFQQSSERYKDGLATASDMTQSQAYYLYIKSLRINAQDNLKDARHGLEQITGQEPGQLKHLREDLPMQHPTPDSAKAWVEQAEQTNPTILAARYAVSADEHKLSAARAGHLPTLSLQAGYDKVGSWSNVSRGSSRYGPGTTTVGLVLSVPIFSGGLIQSQVRQAIHQRDVDQGTLETQRRQAARDAYNYFNQVVDGIDSVQAARGSVEAAQKSLASMRAGYDIGTQSLTNVVVAIEQLASVQSQYIVVRHQFILNKLLLKQAAGTVSQSDLQDINRLLQ